MQIRWSLQAFTPQGSGKRISLIQEECLFVIAAMDTGILSYKSNTSVMVSGCHRFVSVLFQKRGSIITFSYWPN